MCTAFFDASSFGWWTRFFLKSLHHQTNLKDMFEKTGHKDLKIIHTLNRQVTRWSSWASCETSKGIAEVVDFFQNHGLLRIHAKLFAARLFSLQDELERFSCAYIRGEIWFEVVSDQCDRSLAIPIGTKHFACVSFLNPLLSGELLCRKKQPRKPPRRPLRKPWRRPPRRQPRKPPRRQLKKQPKREPKREPKSAARVPKGLVLPLPRSNVFTDSRLVFQWREYQKHP